MVSVILKFIMTFTDVLNNPKLNILVKYFMQLYNILYFYSFIVINDVRLLETQNLLRYYMYIITPRVPRGSLRVYQYDSTSCIYIHET